jgi:hypothetical protein
LSVFGTLLVIIIHLSKIGFHADNRNTKTLDSK